ncbi:MAG: restriction endonuclease [Bacteroidales bacterium]|nr:restriction endonuclease [Bacteroidales bacterium]
MPIPDFQSIMLPFLVELRDGQERSIRDLTNILADRFQLTAIERQELLPSGEQTIFGNRVAWVKSHLKNAGLIDNPSRGKTRIADAGLGVLTQNPSSINCRFLKQFPSYRQFIGQSLDKPIANMEAPDCTLAESIATPQELMDSSFQALRKATGEELLDRLRKCSPGYFEIVVVRLLQALGYGATGEAFVTGKAGDGGIDGLIKEDKLGLDVVCVQAKRWETTVGRPIIQAFVGSMDFVRARKGVVITISTFSRDAIDYVERIEGKKVVLLDGTRLTELMMDHNVGVTISKRYELKEVSNDFFEEDMG